VRSVHSQHKEATLLRVFVPKAGGKEGGGFVAGFAVQHYAGEVSHTTGGRHTPSTHPCTTLAPTLASTLAPFLHPPYTSFTPPSPLPPSR
jgi:hypothetical protein